MVDTRRIRADKGSRSRVSIDGPVLYFMSRDQRVNDNWAMLYAQQIAIDHGQPLIVACAIAADYPKATDRQLRFILDGLSDVELELAKLRIQLVAKIFPSVTDMISLADSIDAGAVVMDFNPLRDGRRWREEFTDRFAGSVYEVDAHNIIPCWIASDKQEYAAYTIRPKIQRTLPEFLTEFPKLKKVSISQNELTICSGWRSVDSIIGESEFNVAIAKCQPGPISAQKVLHRFLTKGITNYDQARNNPAVSGQSGLSPYLHFGQISAQRIALEVQLRDENIASQEAFLEELIVRRELADNYCYYNANYDSFTGFPEWARKSLDQHRSDTREYVYDSLTFENGETHDKLWNASQFEMVTSGKMHGFMRMYWAKKILEWTPSPEEALSLANHLNNKHQLDGHDPNGYVGVAWSIGGVHDRAWFERNIFGKVRYMSYDGCKRKFPIDKYIENVYTNSKEKSR